MRLIIRISVGLLACIGLMPPALAEDFPLTQDRTEEVRAVVSFLRHVQTHEVPDEFQSKFRIYEHPSQRTLSFADLTEYVRQCPLKEITLPFLKPGVGPVIVRWECGVGGEARSAGFFFEGGVLAAVNVGQEGVNRDGVITVKPVE